MKNPEEKKKYYKQMCFRYGFLTLCYLIDMYADEENYEECNLILLALRELNAKFQFDLPTQYTEYAINYMERAMDEMCDNRSHVIMENIIFYAEEIRSGI